MGWVWLARVGHLYMKTKSKPYPPTILSLYARQVLAFRGGEDIKALLLQSIRQIPNPTIIHRALIRIGGKANRINHVFGRLVLWNFGNPWIVAEGG